MLRRRLMLSALGAVALASLAAACGGGSAGTGPPPVRTTPTASPTPPQTPLGHVKHIVIVVQENRSFDNLFHGFPGTDSVSVGQSQIGPIPLEPSSLAAPYDLGHEHATAPLVVDGGKMDGWLHEPVMPRKGSTAPPYPQYVYVPAAEIGPYWAMAKWGVLGDRFFGMLDASFVAHQYLIAGQAANTINVPNEYPWGCDGGSGDRVQFVDAQGNVAGTVFPCFKYRTLGDELSARGISWRYYAPGYGHEGYTWSAYDAIRDIRLTGAWTEHVASPETQFLSDVSAGNLAAVSWVIPSALNSDHIGNGSTMGPAWVATVVNAVGHSRYWSDCAVLVLWDDWGGLYDHVAPPLGDQFGPGVRVPLFVLSPFALRGTVAHTPYTFGSVMRLVEDAFGLQRLTTFDAQAASLGTDVFDFNQAPRRFGPAFGSRGDRARILAEPASNRPPDEE